MLIRVDFRFPDHSEVRYIDQVPMRGCTLRSQGNKWLVKGVNRDVNGCYSVSLLAMNERRPRIGGKPSLGGGIRARRRFDPGRTGKQSA